MDSVGLIENTLLDFRRMKSRSLRQKILLERELYHSKEVSLYPFSKGRIPSENEHRELSEGKMFYIVIWVVVTWAHTCIKIH